MKEIDTAVKYKGKVAYYLNIALIKKQKLNDKQIEMVKSLHISKLKLFDDMKETDDVFVLRRMANDFKKIEFMMQEVWGFPKDENMHEWYTVPKCSCPKTDNEECRGTAMRYYNEGCVIHGEKKMTDEVGYYPVVI